MADPSDNGAHAPSRKRPFECVGDSTGTDKIAAASRATTKSDDGNDARAAMHSSSQIQEMQQKIIDMQTKLDMADETIADWQRRKTQS